MIIIELTFENIDPTLSLSHTHTHARTKNLKRRLAKEWQTPIGCLIFIGHFLQKSPIIRISFAERDLQTKAS